MSKKIPLKKKICNECKTEQYIWARGKCKDCCGRETKRTIKRTPIVPKNNIRKNAKPKRKPTGEKILFEVIWNTRPHICVNCKIPLGNEAKTYYFSHIKPKSTHPELRLLAENIQLLCLFCHQEHDHGSKERYEKRKDLFTHNQKG